MIINRELVYGGDGLAHGRWKYRLRAVVLPGEEVPRLSIKEKKLIWAELLESRRRRRIGEAKCPHFQKCGGCHYNTSAGGTAPTEERHSCADASA